MVTAVSDTAVDATDDVTAKTAVLSRETTASQNPGSRLHSTLASGVSRGVSQITTAVTPTDAAASTQNAVVQLSFATATVTDVQTLKVEADPAVSPSGTTLVLTDGTVPAPDTVTAFINKVSPSTQPVSLTTEAVAQANDVLTPADDAIASAMDYAASTTISASLASDEFAQTTNEMNGKIIPVTGGIALVTEIVPLLTDAITLALDNGIQGPTAASTTKAVAFDKNLPSPALPVNLPVTSAPESAETVPPDDSSSKLPSTNGFNLEAPEVARPSAVTVPEAPAPEAFAPKASPPPVAVTEASLLEAPKPESPPSETAASEGPLQIPASKSNSRDPASLSETLAPDTRSLEASAPKSPPVDTVGPKVSPTSYTFHLSDNSFPNVLPPIPKAKQGEGDLAPIEKETSESAKSRNHGKKEKKTGTFPYCIYAHP